MFGIADAAYGFSLFSFISNSGTCDPSADTQVKVKEMLTLMGCYSHFIAFRNVYQVYLL